MIAYRHPLPIYGSGPSAGEPAPPATRKPSERVEQIRFDPATKKWYLTTSAGRAYAADTRSAVVLKAHDDIKLRDPTNPWSPPEAKQRGEVPVTTYANMTVKELQLQGKQRQLKGWHAMTKGQLTAALIQLDLTEATNVPGNNVIELNPATPEQTPDPWAIPEMLRVTPEEAERRKKANVARPLEPAFRVTNTPEEPAAASSKSTARGKRGSNQGRTIHLLKRDNPKRPGTAAHERYALYREGMTVAEFLKAGGSSADISFDQTKKFIELRNGKH